MQKEYSTDCIRFLRSGILATLQLGYDNFEITISNVDFFYVTDLPFNRKVKVSN